MRPGRARPVDVEHPPRAVAVGDAALDGDALPLHGRVQQAGCGAAREQGGAQHGGDGR